MQTEDVLPADVTATQQLEARRVANGVCISSLQVSQLRLLLLLFITARTAPLPICLTSPLSSSLL